MTTAQPGSHAEARAHTPAALALHPQPSPPNPGCALQAIGRAIKQAALAPAEPAERGFTASGELSAHIKAAAAAAAAGKLAPAGSKRAPGAGGKLPGKAQ